VAISSSPSLLSSKEASLTSLTVSSLVALVPDQALVLEQELEVLQVLVLVQVLEEVLQVLVQVLGEVLQVLGEVLGQAEQVGQVEALDSPPPILRS
jgi:nucleoside permease NupC